jgi:hypothetical protein
MDASWRAALDPKDASQVRLVLVTALGPPPGDDPDQRELVLSCPRDMKLGTAIPHNLDRPARSDDAAR